MGKQLASRLTRNQKVFLINIVKGCYHGHVIIYSYVLGFLGCVVASFYRQSPISVEVILSWGGWSTAIILVYVLLYVCSRKYRLLKRIGVQIKGEVPLKGHPLKFKKRKRNRNQGRKGSSGGLS